MTSSNQDIKTHVAALACRRGVRSSCLILRRVSFSMLALEKIMASSRCVVLIEKRHKKAADTNNSGPTIWRFE